MLRCPHVLMGAQLREAAQRRARAAAACSCEPRCYPARDLACPVHGLTALLARAGAATPPEMP